MKRKRYARKPLAYISVNQSTRTAPHPNSPPRGAISSIPVLDDSFAAFLTNPKTSIKKQRTTSGTNPFTSTSKTPKISNVTLGGSQLKFYPRPYVASLAFRRHSDGPKVKKKDQAVVQPSTPSSSTTATGGVLAAVFKKVQSANKTCRNGVGFQPKMSRPPRPEIKQAVNDDRFKSGATARGADGSSAALHVGPCSPGHSPYDEESKKRVESIAEPINSKASALESVKPETTALNTFSSKPKNKHFSPDDMDIDSSSESVRSEDDGLQVKPQRPGEDEKGYGQHKAENGNKENLVPTQEITQKTPSMKRVENLDPPPLRPRISRNFVEEYRKIVPDNQDVLKAMLGSLASVKTTDEPSFTSVFSPLRDFTGVIVEVRHSGEGKVHEENSFDDISDVTFRGDPKQTKMKDEPEALAPFVGALPSRSSSASTRSEATLPIENSPLTMKISKNASIKPFHETTQAQESARLLEGKNEKGNGEPAEAVTLWDESRMNSDVGTNSPESAKFALKPSPDAKKSRTPPSPLSASGVAPQRRRPSSTEEGHLPLWTAELSDLPLWTAELSGYNNITQIFRLSDGRLFQHPPLPPGWTIELSRSRDFPYYRHPDLGSTFYPPVVMPSLDGLIRSEQVFVESNELSPTDAKTSFPSSESGQEVVTSSSESTSVAGSQKTHGCSEKVGGEEMKKSGDTETTQGETCESKMTGVSTEYYPQDVEVFRCASRHDCNSSENEMPNQTALLLGKKDGTPRSSSPNFETQKEPSNPFSPEGRNSEDLVVWNDSDSPLPCVQSGDKQTSLESNKSAEESKTENRVDCNPQKFEPLAEKKESGKGQVESSDIHQIAQKGLLSMDLRASCESNQLQVATRKYGIGSPRDKSRTFSPYSTGGLKADAAMDPVKYSQDNEELPIDFVERQEYFSDEVSPIRTGPDGRGEGSGGEQSLLNWSCTESSFISYASRESFRITNPSFPLCCLQNLNALLPCTPKAKSSHRKKDQKSEKSQVPRSILVSF